MLKYKNLTIIGTSHIAMQSIKEVESLILKIKPSIIALELDSLRFAALTKRKRRLNLSQIRKLGFRVYFLSLVGSYIEKKLGKLVKVSPGSEMKKAIALANETKARIFLIDQDITITLRRLSHSITKKEIFRLLLDFITAPFKKQQYRIDLTKVPSKKIINEMLNQLKKRYPNIYKTLIKERNIIISKNLKDIMFKYPDEKIIAIVGAGHEDAIIKELKCA